MTESMSTSKFNLNNGIKMPAIGLGTFRIRNETILYTVIEEALEAGYRLFDTATVYHNEAALGKVLQQLLPRFGLEREDIFITTKLAPVDMGGRIKVEQAYENSINNLGIEYADLYLIHFPGAQRLPSSDKRNAEIRHASWEAMVELYDEGRVSAIGVSNFTLQHLKDLMECNQGVVPTVNQVEWHPFYFQPDLQAFCTANDIVLQAYSSFGGLSVDNVDLLNHHSVTKIARRLGVANAQVLLRWALQSDVAIIPKAIHPDHIRANIALNFKIPNEDIKELDSLSLYNTKYAWDPNPVA